MRLNIRAAITIFVLLPAIPTMGADADLSRGKVVQIGKAATALVEVPLARGKGYGAAFCVHPAGFFISNADVVGAPGERAPLLAPNVDSLWRWNYDYLMRDYPRRLKVAAVRGREN